MFNVDKISKTIRARHGLILGITAVLLLELGFTTVLSTNDLTERSEVVIARADDHGAELPVGDLSHASILPEDLMVSPAPADGSEPEGQRVRRAVVTADRGIRRASYRRPVHASVVRSRTPVKRNAAKLPSLTAHTADDIDRDMDNVREIETAGKKGGEKRSFAATTVSVVKKPYSWVKALGSKLF